MENIELVNTEEGRSEQFPVGMRVLAVDDNPTCLRKLEELLLRCKYHVTKTMESKRALELLRDKSNMFDLVISDVEMPDADGFKLLEIGLEMDLPVIMLSGHCDYDSVMKGILHGACDYLIKPVGLKELRNIWQHVVKKKIKSDTKTNGPARQPLPPPSESHLAPSVSKKRKEKLNESGEENESEDGQGSDEDGDESSTRNKKPRVVWSQELHQKFVTAVQQLGLDKAVPKKILDYMNIEGLTRENVASHLQKYRLYLKKIDEGQPHNMGPNVLGRKDSSYYQMGQLDGHRYFTTTRQFPPSRSHVPTSMYSPLNSSSFIPQGHHPFGTYHRNLLPGVQNSNLFQRTSSPLEPLQFPRSKCSTYMGDCKSIGGSAIGGSFLDSRMSFGSTSTSLPSASSNSLMLQPNYRQPLDRNQSCLEGSSSVPGLSRFPSHNWQGDLKTTSFPSNSLPGFSQDHGTFAGNGPLGNPGGEMQCGTQLLGDFIQNMNALDGQKWEEQNCTMMINNNTFGNVDYPLPSDNNESLICPIGDSATLNNQDYVVQPTMPDPDMNSDRPGNALVDNQNDVFDDIMNEMLKQDENNGMVSMAARFGLDSFPPH